MSGQWEDVDKVRENRVRRGWARRLDHRLWIGVECRPLSPREDRRPNLTPSRIRRADHPSDEEDGRWEDVFFEPTIGRAGEGQSSQAA
jgi:hypothetical protein